MTRNPSKRGLSPGFFFGNQLISLLDIMRIVKKKSSGGSPDPAQEPRSLPYYMFFERTTPLLDNKRTETETETIQIMTKYYHIMLLKKYGKQVKY